MLGGGVWAISDASMLNCYHNTAGELHWMDIEAVCDPMLQPTVVDKHGPTFDFDDDGKNAADDDEKRIEPSQQNGTVGSQQSRTSHGGAEQSKAKRKPATRSKKEKKKTKFQAR
ncbi:hypothetical protein NW754_004979 [Fusarium falciforme]|nr:hypothetical protein NW754_004979 [Fusarium falciforme]